MSINCGHFAPTQNDWFPNNAKEVAFRLQIIPYIFVYVEFALLFSRTF